LAIVGVAIKEGEATEAFELIILEVAAIVTAIGDETAYRGERKED